MFIQNDLFQKLSRTCKKTAITVGAVCGLMLSSSLAVAAPISATSFGIGGAFTPTAGSSLEDTDALFISNGGNIIVSVGDTLDLALLAPFGTLGTLQDIPTISGFAPIASFLTLVTGVIVDLNTLNVSDSGPQFINLFGDVVIRAPGFDDTVGILTLTGTSASDISFALAAVVEANTPTSVPEPFSLSLLGLGLLGMFGVNRMRARKNSTI